MRLKCWPQPQYIVPLHRLWHLRGVRYNFLHSPCDQNFGLVWPQGYKYGLKSGCQSFGLGLALRQKSKLSLGPVTVALASPSASALTRHQTRNQNCGPSRPKIWPKYFWPQLGLQIKNTSLSLVLVRLALVLSFETKMTIAWTQDQSSSLGLLSRPKF